jgi:invasion protein IalB
MILPNCALDDAEFCNAIRDNVASNTPNLTIALFITLSVSKSIRRAKAAHFLPFGEFIIGGIHLIVLIHPFFEQ